MLLFIIHMLDSVWGGIFPHVPPLWGLGLTPKIPLLAVPPASHPTHLPGALPFPARRHNLRSPSRSSRPRALEPHLALGSASLTVPRGPPPGDDTSPARGLSSCSGFAGAPKKGGARFARVGAPSGWRGQDGGAGLPVSAWSDTGKARGGETRGKQEGGETAKSIRCAGHRS